MLESHALRKTFGATVALNDTAGSLRDPGETPAPPPGATATSTGTPSVATPPAEPFSDDLGMEVTR